MSDEHCERHDTEGTDGLCTCSAQRTMERAQRDRARTEAAPGLAKARAVLSSVAVPTYGRRRRHPSTENMRRP